MSIAIMVLYLVLHSRPREASCIRKASTIQKAGVGLILLVSDISLCPKVEESSGVQECVLLGATLTSTVDRCR